MSLAELFPDGDYRFHLTLRRGEPREFFAAQDSTGAVLAERARWLAADPERYAALLPEGEPLLSEFAHLAAIWGAAAVDTAIQDVANTHLSPTNAHVSPTATLLRLGFSLEPDILFLSADAAGEFRLRGGVLCFPTGWALREKLGHTLEFIHGVVPGLNPALGAAIGQFLAKLKPGVAFLRDNWGIAASAESNLHPARNIASLTLPVAPDRLWLRVERQALVALPQSRGIVFGIRIDTHRLDALAGTPAGAGLRRGLETMPAELAAYKRLDAVRHQIAAQL